MYIPANVGKKIIGATETETEEGSNPSTLVLAGDRQDLSQGPESQYLKLC